MQKEKIGEKIKEARIKLKLRQDVVSEHLKCPQSTISRIENGSYFGFIFLEYLVFLKSKKVDLNTIFDIEEDEVNSGASPS